MTMQIGVTPPQLRELRYAARNHLGVNDSRAFQYGWQGAGWRKVMKALLAKGLVQHYPHGGYEITQRGRDVVKSRDDGVSEDKSNG